jgi:hypothetical protein
LNYFTVIKQQLNWAVHYCTEIDEPRDDRNASNTPLTGPKDICDLCKCRQAGAARMRVGEGQNETETVPEVPAFRLNPAPDQPYQPVGHNRHMHVREAVENRKQDGTIV